MHVVAAGRESTEMTSYEVTRFGSQGRNIVEKLRVRRLAGVGNAMALAQERRL